MYFKKAIICFLLIAGLVGMQAGCAAKDNGQPVNSGASNSSTSESTTKKDDDKQKAVMGEFDALVQKNAELTAVVDYVNKNISGLAKDNASKMVVSLEKLQKAGMPKLEEKFYSEPVQKAMVEAYMTSFDINKLDEIKDEKVKSVLKEVKDSNYKVETAEGMFFPIINYGAYRTYSEYVTPDIKEYIELMAVESDEVPAKDAGLVIGWDEVLKRAQNQEKFVATYGSSEKAADVKQLYKNYVTFALYGANNTPLFAYDTKTVEPDAKASLEKFLSDSSSNSFTEIIKSYYEVLKKSDFKLTDGVDKYRKSVIDSL